MSFMLAGLAFTRRINTGAKVASTDKLVLLALADTADDDGSCWPKLSYLAAKCEMSEDTVRRSVYRLIEAGYVSTTKRFDQTGRQLSNGYRIVQERLRSSEEIRIGLHDATPPLQEQGGEGCSNTTPGGSRKGRPRTYHRNLSVEPIPPTPLVDLPDWLPKESWDAYQQHRIDIKKPLTKKAAELAIRELGYLRSLGNDPVAVIEQSILNGWRGLFALKHARNGYPNGSNRAQTKHERQLEIANEIRSRAQQHGDVQDGRGTESGTTIEGVAETVG